jgi:hypothetical protein
MSAMRSKTLSMVMTGSVAGMEIVLC